MALIRHFFELNSQGTVHRSETDAGWAKVQNGDQVLLYIGTYGSETRMSRPKTSQVIQLDRERASELIKIIREVFPDIENTENRTPNLQ
ncbi:MAG TPA: hypothetical protein H9786_13195 [Candidatus Brachybacterium merdavium]|uniref:Uncharacterized protein n=1 Tax=Candidatus Brachybacterium merdavium TaxID=2838513 RepID=A0A9D2LFQ8_9MICO|nr:hypothetical protein [Candidatus Brachybacterium merdavium]